MLESPVTRSRAGIVLTVKNYGPISRGRVVLKPLTILVGPNGCGKTHTTSLLHSVLKAEGKRIDWDLKDVTWLRDEEMNWHLRDRAPSSVLCDEARRIHTRIEMGGAVDSDICKHVAAVWAKSLESELKHNSPGSFYDRIRAGSEYFELEVATEINRGKFVYKVGLDEKFETVEIDNTNLEIEFKKYQDNSEMDSDRKPYRDEKTIHVNVPDICDERAVLNALKDGVAARAESDLKRSVYFSAERSGLTILMYMMLQEQRKRTGHQKPLHDNLTGTMADLFSWLSDIQDQSMFAHMAESFEADALGGKVVLETDPMIPPYLSYVLGKESYTMAEVSSSVRDVALFLAYIKYAAKSGDMVILEEPEMNLHPDNQVLLARLIARLTAAGLRMVVSTHSPYFLEQLSHCVVGGAILNEESGKVLPHDECLGTDRVAAYQFVPHDGNYEICPLEITEDGISQTEFTNVDRKLYEELTKLWQADER